MKNNTTRRSSLKKIGMGLAALFGVTAVSRAMNGSEKP
jgi:2-iminobutanoate/2-iminopropanoate deaminase